MKLGLGSPRLFFERKEASSRKKDLLAQLDAIMNEDSSSRAQDLAALARTLIDKVDRLSLQVEDTQAQLDMARQESDHARDLNRDHVHVILEALKGKAMAPPTTQAGVQALSAQDATDLVVSGLTRKIEGLETRNQDLLERNDELETKILEVESENIARQHKIEALELQFKSINKTRQKMMNKLADRSNRVEKAEI